MCSFHKNKVNEGSIVLYNSLTQSRKNCSNRRFFAHTLTPFVLVNIAKMYQFAHPSWYENRVMPRKNTTIKCSFDFSSYPTIFGLKRHVLNCNLFGFVISLFFWVKYYVSLQKFLQLNKCILLYAKCNLKQLETYNVMY